MHGWAEFWDNWAKTFGYEIWVWGSAADWFAAIGTVGALALALMLLLRDQIRAGRSAADSFITWRSDELHGRAGGGHDTVYVIHAYNAGDAPLASAFIQYVNPHTGKTEAFMLGSGHKGVPPKTDSVNRSSPFGATEKPQMLVIFRDRHGKSWVRDIENGKYLHCKKRSAALKASATFV